MSGLDTPARPELLLATAADEDDVVLRRARDRSRLGRNITALTGGQLVTWVMTLGWTLVVPRALGPVGMGQIVTAWSVTGILGIVLGLGTRNYLVREMVVERGRMPRLVGTAILLRILLSPLFVIAVLAYGRFAGYGHEGTLVLDLAAIATLLTLAAEPLLAAFQSLERMEYLAYSDVINKSAQALLGIVLALLGFRAAGIIGGWVVVAGVVLVLDVLWLRGHFRIAFRSSLQDIADMIRNSLAYWAFGAFFMAYLWIDAVMLSLLTDSEVVGWYGVATKLFQSLMFVPVVVSTAWLPRLVTSFEQRPEQLRRAARRPLELVAIVSLPICAATLIVAQPLIHLLYGGAYDDAVPVLVVLGICVPPMYVNIVLNNVLVAAKRQVLWTWVMAGATVVNPLFNLALIPATQQRYDNGAIGAALSLLLTELLIVAAGFVIVGGEVLARQALRRVAVAAGAAAAMWSVAYEARFLGSGLSLAGGSLAFVLVAVVLRLATPEEIGLVRLGVARGLNYVSRRGRRGRGHDEDVGPGDESSGHGSPPAAAIDGAVHTNGSEQHSATADALPAAPRAGAEVHLVFAWTAGGYVLLEWDGTLPGVGATLSLEGGAQHLVTMLGPSPLPDDGRRCAFLQPVC